MIVLALVTKEFLRVDEEEIIDSALSFVGAVGRTGCPRGLAGERNQRHVQEGMKAVGRKRNGPGVQLTGRLSRGRHQPYCRIRHSPGMLA